MRIRYERREPRAEDIRTIQELKTVIDAQDKDLRRLTEQLREIQMHQQCGNGATGEMADQQHHQQSHSVRKPKKNKIKCDIIYEENEEQENASNDRVFVE